MLFFKKNKKNILSSILYSYLLARSVSLFSLSRRLYGRRIGAVDDEDFREDFEGHSL